LRLGSSCVWSCKGSSTEREFSPSPPRSGDESSSWANVLSVLSWESSEARPTARPSPTPRARSGGSRSGIPERRNSILPLWGESTARGLHLQTRFCERRKGASDTEPTPLPTFGETVQVTEGGDVETLFYPAMLYTSRRIFIQIPTSCGSILSIGTGQYRIAPPR
jgi:hypothetical protein